MADAEESVRGEDVEQQHPGLRVRSAAQRGVQNGVVFVRASGECGERGGAGVSDGDECDHQYDVGRGGGRGGEGEFGGGVPGVGDGDDAASGEAQCLGLFSRVGPVRFAARGERDAGVGAPVRWDI